MTRIIGQHLILAIFAVFDPQREPHDPPSFCPRPLNEGEVLVTYHLKPRRKQKPWFQHPNTSESHYTRDNITQGLHRMLLDGRAIKFQIEHLGESEFLIAEILDEPIKKDFNLVKSRLGTIEKHCAEVVS